MFPLYDRFIPRRRINQDRYSLLDRPPEPTTSHGKMLAQFLLPNQERVLSFTSQKRSTDAMESGVEFNLKQQLTDPTLRRPSLKIRPYQFRLEKVLDAPGTLEDYYANTLACTENHLLLALFDADAPGEAQSTIYNWHCSKDEIRSSSSPTGSGTLAYSVQAMNETTIASGWTHGVIRIHDMESSEYIHTINSPEDSTILSLAPMSPMTLVCGNKHGTLHLVDLRVRESTACVVSKFNAHNAASIPGLSYDKDFFIASGSNDNSVKLWDIRRFTNDPIQINKTHTAGVKALMFHGKNLISGGGTACRHLCFWKTQSDIISDRVDTSSQITGIQPIPNSSLIVTSHGYNENSLKLWHISKNGCFVKKAETPIKPSGRILSLAVFSKKNKVAALNEKGAVHIFDVTNGERHLPAADDKKPTHAIPTLESFPLIIR